MRLTSLVVTAVLLTAPLAAQAPASSSASPTDPSPSQDGAQDNQTKPDLPVSLDNIRKGLAQPAPPLRGLTDGETPHFKVEINEKQKISLEDLIKNLDFKAGPVPGGGLYGFEQQRQMFPAVDNPLRQPYSAFNQPELLTILIENLVGRYLAGKAAGAITSAERAHAEAAAKDDVQRAVREYCDAQPNHGAGIQICANPIQ
jgi:hypothetical protein